MTRSLGLSVIIHLALLVVLLSLLALGPAEEKPAPETPTVLVRRAMLADRSETPELIAGNLQEASAPRELPTPSPAEPPLPEPAGEPAPPAEQPPKESGERRTAPRFLLPAPDYPTHRKGPEQTATGKDALNLKGEKEAEDRPAIPYYHPSISLEGRQGRDWILVRFEIEANGTFKVEMLEGTGDIHQDARVLNVLRRWKWLPMKINGETYRSVEVIRLYRRDV